MYYNPNLTYSTGHGTGVGNATLLANPNLCTLETCDLSMGSFMYLPTSAGNGLLAGIFGALVIGQLYLGIKNKTWGYMSAMILGLILEIIGYVARVMLHNSPFDNNDFLMSLVCLTIAPALLSASIYLCLARIITVYGSHISYFKPRTYTIFFCTCDFICLILQAAGGAIASSSNTESGSNLGKNIMLAGLIIQVISLTLFAACCTEFAIRVRKASGNWESKYLYVSTSKLFNAFLISLAVSTLAIFVRSVYRCAELAGGFNGTLFTSDEALFMILEGAMIAIATILLTAFHPAVCFQGAWDEANFSLRNKKNTHEKLYAASSDIESGVELRTATMGVRYENTRVSDERI